MEEEAGQESHVDYHQLTASTLHHLTCSIISGSHQEIFAAIDVKCLLLPTPPPSPSLTYLVSDVCGIEYIYI